MAYNPFKNRKELNNLRKEANRIRTNTTRKISRIKNKQEIIVSGTAYDPRKPVGAEKKMNKAQLNAYINQMKEFNRPLHKFEAISGNKPILKTEAAKFHRLAEQVNARRDKFTSRLNEQKFPGMAKSPGEFQRQGESPTEPGYGSMFDNVVEDLSGVRSLSALKKLEASLAAQLKPDKFKANLDLGRQQASRMMEINGQQENVDLLNSLSDFQFAMFWYGSAGPERIFMMDSDQNAVRDEAEDSSANSEIRGLLRQAESLPAIDIVGGDWEKEIHQKKKSTGNNRRKTR